MIDPQHCTECVVSLIYMSTLDVCYLSEHLFLNFIVIKVIIMMITIIIYYNCYYHYYCYSNQNCY